MRKGTRGTHYTVSGDRKAAAITIRLRDADKAMITGKAKAAGLSVADFIVQACAARRVKDYNPAPAQMPGQMSLDDYPQQDA